MDAMTTPARRYTVEHSLYSADGDFTGIERILETDDRDEAIDVAERNQRDEPNGQTNVYDWGANLDNETLIHEVR